MTTKKFKAGDKFPLIEVDSLESSVVTLGKPSEQYDWKLVVVYRGKHCPLCTRYLNEIEKSKTEFQQLGVDIIAVSADNRSQAKSHFEQLNVSFPISFGLSIEQMQQLGVYISSPRSPQETDHPFAEPGLFVINEKDQVQIIDISNGPFVRPELNILLSGIRFIRDPDNNYPIRGTYE